MDLNRVDASERHVLMERLRQTGCARSHPQGGLQRQARIDNVFAARISELEVARRQSGEATAGLYAASPESFPPSRSMEDSLQRQIAGNLGQVVQDRLSLDGGIGDLSGQIQRGLRGENFPDPRPSYLNSRRVLGSLAAGIQLSGQSPRGP